MARPMSPPRRQKAWVGAVSDGGRRLRCVRTLADLPWPPGAATGVGSMPGTAVRESLRVVLGELPDLPHLPELPARGPGADLVGRTLVLLPDLGAQWTPTGWQVSDRAGADLRRASAWLAEDLDALEELAAGWSGALKVQVCGPWTLAATVELRTGRKALGDAGAVRDLGQALVEGTAAHVDGLRRRLPGARLVLQLDEPALPAVLAGAVPTPSGLSRLAAVDEPVAEQLLATTLRSLPDDVVPVVHCCAANAPVALLRRAGARAVSLDGAVLGDPGATEPLAEGLEAGLGLLLGVVPAGTADLPAAGAAVAAVRDWWRQVGLASELLGRRVVPTPSCGLAGVTPAAARAALARCREAGRVLLDDPEGGRG
jgi:hypothetical protein